MARLRTVSLATALALLVVLASSSGASSTPGPTMRLDPASIDVEGQSGESFSLDVLVEDVAELGGFDFEVHFDDAVLNVDVIEGPFLGSKGATVNCLENVVGGIAHFACFTIGAGPLPSGTGVLAQLDFTLKAPFAGAADLRLEDCVVADQVGNALPLNGCKDGTITGHAPVGGVAMGAAPRGLDSNANATTHSAAAWLVAVAAFAAGALATGAVLLRLGLAGVGREGRRG